MPCALRSSYPDLQWALASVSSIVSMSEDFCSVAMSENMAFMKDLKLCRLLDGGKYASMTATGGTVSLTLSSTRSNRSALQVCDLVYLDRRARGVH